MGGFAQQRAAQLQDERFKQQDDEKQLQIAPLSQQLNADRVRLAAYVDPKTMKPLDGHEQDYETTIDRMAQTIGSLRTLMGGHAPHEDPNGLKLAAAKLLDRTHITNDLSGHMRSDQSQKVNDYNAQNRGAAEAAGRGVIPYELTDDYKKEQQRIDGQVKVAEARLASGGWTRNGQPVKVDGQWMQPFVNKMGETMMNPMPEGYSGPSTKMTKGTLVRSKQSPTGFAQTYVDPYNPGKVVGWQPITPSRYYEGTQTSSTSKDPFGVVTTSNRVTTPMNGGQVELGTEVDLSGSPQVPGDEGSVQAAPTQTAPSGNVGNPNTPNSTPNAPPQIQGPGHKQLQQVRARTQEAPKAGAQQLDENGHIPESAEPNAMLREAANQLLDGMDINKLNVPAKDKQAAAHVAGKFGWEQGRYTPRELTQFKVATAFLQQFHDSPALSVLDSYVSREKIARAMDPNGGMIDRAIAKNLSGPEAEFIRFYNAALGTIQGLTTITRSGRATEASVNRLKAELPSIMQSASSKDAKLRLEQLFKELSLAVDKDSSKGGPKTQQLQNSSSKPKLTAADLEKALEQ
jgi:hypothetical protein